MNKLKSLASDRARPPSTTAGANPTIASYNASYLKICNATSRLVRYESKKIFYYEKRCSLLPTTLALQL
jgi:hypothetical protein